MPELSNHVLVIRSERDRQPLLKAALPAAGLVLTWPSVARMSQATRYSDPRAYQAYVEEMVCLP